MKKKILLFFFLLNCSALAAQGLQYGFRGGVNLSSILLPEDDERILPAWGLNLAGVLGVHPFDNSSFLLEVAYNQKGYSFFESAAANSEIEYTERYKYISIPLLYRYEIGSLMKYYVSIGAEANILMSAERDGEQRTYSSVYGVSKIPLDTKVNNAAPITYGAILGFGVIIPRGASSLFFDCRFSVDIITGGELESKQFSHEVFGISLGYLF